MPFYATYWSKRTFIYLIAMLVLYTPLLRGQSIDGIPIITELDMEQVPAGVISKYWLHITSNGLSQPILIPVIVAKGLEAGPVLGLTAAIHGNELNGIPIIQAIFQEIDPKQLKGALVGVPGLNPVSMNLNERRFPDQEDLNRNFPGKEQGDDSQQFVWRIFQKIVRHFDFHIDMHTASFGRINSLYVRADMKHDTSLQMAMLQDADIVLHNEGKPSSGQVIAASRTMRAEAMLHGIPSITIEYGDPQVYQPEMIERGITGVKNTMSWLGMVEMPIQMPAKKPIVCKKSYWVYVDEGGLLDIPVQINQLLKKGDLIGVLKNPFGDVIKSYFAPEDGVVIGKSTNPVNMNGGRIIHLGVLE